MNVSLILVVGSPFKMWVTCFWMLFFSLSLSILSFSIKHTEQVAGSLLRCFGKDRGTPKPRDGLPLVLAFFLSFKFQGWPFVEGKGRQAHLSSSLAAFAPLGQIQARGPTGELATLPWVELWGHGSKGGITKGDTPPHLPNLGTTMFRALNISLVTE